MIDVNRQGDVWVFAEQEEGTLSDVPLELLTRGRELADQLKVPLGAVLAGHQVGDLCEPLIQHGADKVYLADAPALAHYQSTSYAKVLVDLIHEHKPQIVLYGATNMGRDLAPRVASECRAGLTADCTDLEIGTHKEPSDKQTYDDLLMQIRPAFGGNIIATIVNFDRWPQMATVREGVMRLGEADTSRTGQIIQAPVNEADLTLPLRLIERYREPRKVNLKASRVVVAGGAGVGSQDNFRLIWDLANVLGGAPAGSRAAVDNGYIPKDHQVGQTGTTVRPALYVAVGISGAVQHRAGMQESGKIVAINSDSDAPIFGIAHYGIVGDLNDIVPRMIKAIKKRV